MAKSVDELISGLEQYARGEGTLGPRDLELAAALQRELATGRYEDDDPKGLAKALKVAEGRVARGRVADDEDDEDEADEDRLEVEEGDGDETDEEDEEEEAPADDIPPQRRARKPRIEKSASSGEAEDDDDADDVDDLVLESGELNDALEGLSDVVDVGPAIEAIARNSAVIAKSMTKMHKLYRELAPRVEAMEKSLATREPLDLKDAVAEALEKSAAGKLAEQFRELQERTDALQDVVDGTVVNKHPRLSKSAGLAGSVEPLSTGQAIEIIRKSVSAGDLSEDDGISAFRELRTGDPLPVLRRFLPEKLEAHIRSATA